MVRAHSFGHGRQVIVLEERYVSHGQAARILGRLQARERALLEKERERERERQRQRETETETEKRERRLENG